MPSQPLGEQFSFEIFECSGAQLLSFHGYFTVVKLDCEYCATIRALSIGLSFSWSRLFIRVDFNRSFTLWATRVGFTTNFLHIYHHVGNDAILSYHTISNFSSFFCFFREGLRRFEGLRNFNKV